MALLTKKKEASKSRIGCRVRSLHVLMGITVSLQSITSSAAAEPTPGVSHGRFGDWEVICAPGDKPARCSAIQRQSTKTVAGSALQRVIAMELMVVPEGAVGTLLTPFGVDLSKGVSLKLGKVGPPLPFRTCLPTGCVVTLQFGPEAVQSLRSESVLNVSLSTIGNERRIDLPISLTGLAQALDEAKKLSGASR